MTFDFANELMSELILSDSKAIFRDYEIYLKTGDKAPLVATCHRLGLSIKAVLIFFNEG